MSEARSGSATPLSDAGSGVGAGGAGGKKGGKGKKAAGRIAPKAGGGKGETLSELTREFYTIQIHDLEERLERYQEKSADLEVANEDHTREVLRLTADQHDIVEFLNSQLARKEEEISKLGESTIQLQHEKEAQHDEFELEIASINSKSKETIQALTDIKDELTTKLEDLNNFRERKEEMEAKMLKLEENIENHKKAHQDVISDMERKAVQDKDRLKKGMLVKVSEVVSDFRQISDKQMAETTKRTIRENITINQQLAKMSARTMEVIEENNQLTQKSKKDKLHIEMLQQSETELAKKNFSNQKVIHMLLNKLKWFETNMESYQEQAELCEHELRKRGHLSSHIENILKQSLEEKQGSIRKGEEELKNALSSLDAAFAEISSLRQGQEKLVSLIDETTSFILITLQDAKAEVINGPENDVNEDTNGENLSVPCSLLDCSAKDREKILNYLLSKLSAFQRVRGEDGTEKTNTKSRLASDMDLPRKTVSVGIQTVSAQKALFFAEQLLSATNKANETGGARPWQIPQEDLRRQWAKPAVSGCPKKAPHHLY